MIIIMISISLLFNPSFILCKWNCIYSALLLMNIIWHSMQPDLWISLFLVEPFCLANYPSAFHSVMFNPTEPRLLATANSKEGVGLWDIRKPRRWDILSVILKSLNQINIVSICFLCSSGLQSSICFNHCQSIVTYQFHLMSGKSCLVQIMFDHIERGGTLLYDHGQCGRHGPCL